MKSTYQYSQKEQQQILKSITILCDTREKKDSHITDWFTSKGIPFQKYKLNFGDYSFMVPANPAMGTVRDMYFTKEIVIERKAHLEELSQNLAQKRDQFENEFLRARDCRKILMIEKGSLSDILDAAYATQLTPQSYFASLLTFQSRYGIETIFMPTKYSAQLIYATFYYHMKELLDNGI